MTEAAESVRLLCELAAQRSMTVDMHCDESDDPLSRHVESPAIPKRCGKTRVPELMAAGLTVAFGHDCVLDPWYPMDAGDTLKLASMGLHGVQMTGTAVMRVCLDAATVNAVSVLDLDGSGWSPATARISSSCRPAIRSRRSERRSARRGSTGQGDRREPCASCPAASPRPPRT